MNDNDPRIDTNNDTNNDELPVFPTVAPTVFVDPDQTASLFGPVLTELASMVEVADEQLDDPTPCDGFTVAQLRRHVLAWLQFFADALGDPAGNGPRIDPETWQLGSGDDPTDIVTRSAASIERAIRGGVANELVVMSQARMAGTGVLAMALGEYLVHGWDLAVSTGRTVRVDDHAAEPALAFLRTTVAPEHRGPDTGFFDVERPAPADASAFTQLLCFAGRDPEWRSAVSN